MHDQPRPSLLRAVIVTAVLVVMAGLIWPHVDQWYYQVIAILADSFSPVDVSISATAGIIAISHVEYDGTFFIKGMVLALGTILPTVVAATTPTMQISSRSISILAVVLIALLSQTFMLVYVAHGVTQQSSTDMPVIFSVYWLIFPSITAALWCYIFWLPRLKKATAGDEGRSEVKEEG